MPKDIEQSHIIPPTYRETSEEPGRGPAFRGPRLRRRRTGLFVSLTLVTLAAIVVLASLLMHFASRGPLAPGRQAAVPAGPLGPFVEPPYNASQVNALWHLVDRMTYRQLAYLYVTRMSLAEKLGQMIMTESEQNAYSDDLDYMITQLHVGGMIMYESHLQTSSQARTNTSLAQQRAKIPLLTSVDEEGGPYVNRLVHIYGSRPGPWEIYQAGSLSFDRQQGVKMAHDLLSIGLNTDLAPDVDVMIVPGIDTAGRTFGTTAASVIKYAGPYIEAMQSHGLIACLKHYPGGLGDTPYDAHDILPSDTRSRDQIYATELAPYKTFINSPNPLVRPAMIMSTDVLMPAIDPKMPAELSHIFMTLRWRGSHRRALHGWHLRALERASSGGAGDPGWQRHDSGSDGECSHGGGDRGTQTGAPGWSALDGARERGGDAHHRSEDAVSPHACHAAAELMVVRDKH